MHGFFAIYKYFANPCLRILFAWDKYGRMGKGIL